jgi:hypothetical protein
MRLALAFRVKDADVDAWLARIEPRVIDQWLAFDQLQGFGDEQEDQRFKVLIAWFCTMLGSKAYSPDDIKGISRGEFREVADDFLDDVELPVWSESTASADVLRDVEEQNAFR